MEPYIGQIQPYAFGFSPQGWAFCNGQLLDISTNTALFALLGTTYGGNGQTTFGLPDLRGRKIVHPGQGTNLQLIDMGEVGGGEVVRLSSSNLPVHIHQLANGTANVTTTITATNNTNASNVTDNGSNGIGTSGSLPDIYRESPTGADSLSGVRSTISGTTGIAGGSLPFGIRSPFLGVFYSIALEGLFPPRN